ncbi:hypothetical protein J2X54_001562 [Duganella sp. 3397]|uniref:hypothetical protein n=1 Tax=Duganella sp. 3397 TaxID=2817732 RepID=UPI00285B2EC4|nr:hypothetical protein [Duganella sp. 3397]MDR7049114.1 hypothetical protein [Duganella sp. 3397]
MPELLYQNLELLDKIWAKWLDSFAATIVKVSDTGYVIDFEAITSTAVVLASGENGPLYDLQPTAHGNF